MSPPSPTPYVQPGEPLNDFLRSFWQRQVDAAEQETPDYRHPPLPLARIKKVMKSDPDVKMIAADAPILFCKACEIFISEITARAFIIADSNKRRTLSRSDIAKALAKSDQFDFLIDIVPREDGVMGMHGGHHSGAPSGVPSVGPGSGAAGSVGMGMGTVANATVSGSANSNTGNVNVGVGSGSPNVGGNVGSGSLNVTAGAGVGFESTTDMLGCDEMGFQSD
ncbi:histone-fold-containing protein [Pisolithus croceorrhizus]|nr:histone-fold-containing protein [Pisolithus croceorrhizus]